VPQAVGLIFKFSAFGEKQMSKTTASVGMLSDASSRGHPNSALDGKELMYSQKPELKMGQFQGGSVQWLSDEVCQPQHVDGQSELQAFQAAAPNTVLLRGSEVSSHDLSEEQRKTSQKPPKMTSSSLVTITIAGPFLSQSLARDLHCHN
jgi:hypothetical protein